MNEQLKILSISRSVLDARWSQRIVEVMRARYGEHTYVPTKRQAMRLHLAKRQDLARIPAQLSSSRDDYQREVTKSMPEGFTRSLLDVPVSHTRLIRTGHTALLITFLEADQRVLDEHQAANELMQTHGIYTDGKFFFQVCLGQVIGRIPRSDIDAMHGHLIPDAMQFEPGTVFTMPAPQ